jgi:hypothetical protein
MKYRFTTFSRTASRSAVSKEWMEGAARRSQVGNFDDKISWLPRVLSQINGWCRENKYHEKKEQRSSVACVHHHTCGGRVFCSSTIWLPAQKCKPSEGCVFKTNCPLGTIREPRCLVFRRAGSCWDTVSRECTMVLPFQYSRTQTAGASAEIWKKGIWNAP